MDLDTFNKRMTGTLPELLGMRCVSLDPDRVVDELTTTRRLETAGQNSGASAQRFPAGQQRDQFVLDLRVADLQPPGFIGLGGVNRRVR